MSDTATMDLDTFRERMAAISEAFVALGKAIAQAWQRIVKWLKPLYRSIQRMRLDRYGLLPGRCYGPMPLLIDGHAYRLRQRKRRH